MSKGKSTVCADIQAAKAVDPPAPEDDGCKPLAKPSFPAGMFDRFFEKGGLLWKDNGEGRPAVVMCGSFQVRARTRDSEGRHGIALAWIDCDRNEHEEVFTRHQLVGECGEVIKTLANGGLFISNTRDGRQALIEYLALLDSRTQAQVVYANGWCQVGDSLGYVLPDKVFGKLPLRVISRTGSREPDIFGQGGTLDAWRVEVAQRCIGNPEAALAVSIAFAAPLLFLTGEDGGGINVYGASRTGKTTLALLCCSCWGGNVAGGGARGMMRSWRGTANSLECVAVLHSDCTLVLDEMGQMDGREIGPAAYQLADGKQKTRLDRSADLRPTLRFRVLYFSTGEVTLSSKMLESGVRAKAGQAVRLIDVPMGNFRDLHDAASPGAFAQQLREAVARNYGTAGRAYMTWLVDRVAREADFRIYLQDEIERISAAWLAHLGAHEGQVRTVARRFALIALAGNLATDAGITAWGKTEDGTREAEWAAHTCFLAWLGDRGTSGAQEDAEAITRLRNFITLHGNSRFEDWNDRRNAGCDLSDTESTPPIERFRTVNRAGWRKWEVKHGRGSWVYYVMKEGMREALAGLDYKSAIKVLVAAKMIIPYSDGNMQPVTTPTGGKQRVFVVPSAVMSAGPSGLSDTGE